ncbi:hypothetical protein KG088_13410 [Halomonas sp. TRM85114]|uniref:hypothetical protein n=1 Tax=Halomonas jincaotanensis TaxID=2810616 RepID=UPI001BD41083|nr:hypothetical protein [Halomonas jincaotanensis]MBS9404632.1 hypothetical protein [Halomonas jincaotanensis]
MNARPASLPATLLIVLLTTQLVGCAGAPERPETLRQALYGLGEVAAERVLAAPALPSPGTSQVLLLATPEVDPTLGIDQERLRESLTRALLGATDGPQVLNWSDVMREGGGDNQWRLESRLDADGPRLTLSDRDLLPYRLTLALRRPGSETALWTTDISGALDASAL